jgi:hypothetical protein
MQRRRGCVGLVLGMLVVAGAVSNEAFAKNKNDKVVPEYILHAHTVAVVIDPEAGMSVEDPRANMMAQKDVEAALLHWGRFVPVTSMQGADLVIVIRREHGRMVDETVNARPQTNASGVINPMDSGVATGVQRGMPPGGTGSGLPDASTREPAGPQMEGGGFDDSFVVYDGDSKSPLSGPVGWRYTGRDGLRSHNVPAVEEFKKVVVAADKAAAAKNP